MGYFSNGPYKEKDLKEKVAIALRCQQTSKWCQPTSFHSQGFGKFLVNLLTFQGGQPCSFSEQPQKAVPELIFESLDSKVMLRQSGNKPDMSLPPYL